MGFRITGGGNLRPPLEAARYNTSKRARGWAAGLLLAVALFLSLGTARADVLNLGILSYQGFIPGVTGGPGTFSVAIDNLTGLPPDFYPDAIDFTNVTLDLLFADHSDFSCNVGLVSSQGTNTECQVSDTTSLESILASGDIPAITSQGGQVFSKFVSRLDLSPDNTLAVISVGTQAPEPSVGMLVMAGLLGMEVKRRRSQRQLASTK